MNAVTITVPQLPPRANQLLRMHWAKRKREQQNWREWLHAEANGCAGARQIRKAVLEGRKMAVEVVLYHSRQDDPDNLHARCKLLLDALSYKRGIGLILDDSPSHIELAVRQHKSTRKDARTQIRIYPVAERELLDPIL